MVLRCYADIVCLPLWIIGLYPFSCYSGAIRFPSRLVMQDIRHIGPGADIHSEGPGKRGGVYPSGWGGYVTGGNRSSYPLSDPTESEGSSWGLGSVRHPESPFYRAWGPDPPAAGARAQPYAQTSVQSGPAPQSIINNHNQ